MSDRFEFPPSEMQTLYREVERLLAAALAQEVNDDLGPERMRAWEIRSEVYAAMLRRIQYIVTVGRI